MDILDLSDFFTTKSQANDFSARLSAVSEMIYEVDFNLEKVLQQQLGLHKKDKFISLLRNSGVQTGSNSALNEFIGKIQETISLLPLATLTLAIEPNEDTLKTVSDWFILNIKRQVVIEIQIDQKLIAGAVVNYQGKHHDASIVPVFNEVCSTNLNEKNL